MTARGLNGGKRRLVRSRDRLWIDGRHGSSICMIMKAVPGPDRISAGAGSEPVAPGGAD